MKQDGSNYHSYLLRLWRSSDDEYAPWHIMLEEPHTGKRHVFSAISNLTAFLSEVISRRPAAGSLREDG